MKKQAYLKMMKMACLNKSAEADYNTLGPLLGILLGMYGGYKTAGAWHKDPGFFTKLLYILGGGALGGYAGNIGQNLLSGTKNDPIWHSLFDGISEAREESKRRAALDKAIAGAHEKGLISNTEAPSAKPTEDEIRKFLGQKEYNDSMKWAKDAANDSAFRAALDKAIAGAHEKGLISNTEAPSAKPTEDEIRKFLGQKEYNDSMKVPHILADWIKFRDAPENVGKYDWMDTPEFKGRANFYKRMLNGGSREYIDKPQLDEQILSTITHKGTSLLAPKGQPSKYKEEPGLQGTGRKR